MKLHGQLVPGLDVQLAYDGPTALQAALEFRLNVVLLDIGSPGLDGYEVAKRILEQPTLKNIVLVAMTGYGSVEDLPRSDDAGFNQHLVKPADFMKVKVILASVSEKATYPSGARTGIKKKRNAISQYLTPQLNIFAQQGICIRGNYQTSCLRFQRLLSAL